MVFAVHVVIKGLRFSLDLKKQTAILFVEANRLFLFVIIKPLSKTLGETIYM